jgi:hypothetical protein
LQTGKSYLLVAGSAGNSVFPGRVIPTKVFLESFMIFEFFNSDPD